MSGAQIQRTHGGSDNIDTVTNRKSLRKGSTR